MLINALKLNTLNLPALVADIENPFKLDRMPYSMFDVGRSMFDVQVLSINERPEAASDTPTETGLLKF